MKVSVIIPAYNAGDTLGDLLADAVEWVDLCDVMVVNDGSDDATAAIIERSPVISLAHVANCGKGRALRTGFAHALSLGYDAVITLDADGQHDPRYIPSMIEIMDAGHWDIIVGSRRNEFGRMSFARYLSNNITTVVVSLLGGKLADPARKILRSSKIATIDLPQDAAAALTGLLAFYRRQKQPLYPVRRPYAVKRLPSRTLLQGRLTWAQAEKLTRPYQIPLVKTISLNQPVKPGGFSWPVVLKADPVSSDSSTPRSTPSASQAPGMPRRPSAAA